MTEYNLNISLLSQGHQWNPLFLSKVLLISYQEKLKA